MIPTQPRFGPGPATTHLVREAAGYLSRLAGIISELERLTGHPHTEAAQPRSGPAAHRDGRLTNREQQVLDLLLQGLSNRRIARTLHISEPTVKNHLHAIFLKLGVTDRTQAIAKVLAERYSSAVPLPRPET